MLKPQDKPSSRQGNKESRVELRGAITEFFKNSHDFNGLLLFKITQFIDLQKDQIRTAVDKLLRQNEIDLAYT